MSKQAKRAAFYAHQRYLRPIRRINKANRNTPGFLGAVTSLKIDGVLVGGTGSLLASYWPAKNLKDSGMLSSAAISNALGLPVVAALSAALDCGAARDFAEATRDLVRLEVDRMSGGKLTAEEIDKLLDSAP